MRYRILAGHLLLLCPTLAAAALVTLETRQTTLASICTGTPCFGATENRVSEATIDAAAHSNNLAGSTVSQSEARTAARSASVEIAANATLRHREPGPFVNYPEVSSDALYEIDVQALDAGPVSLHFHLPPGFVEIQSNAEWGDIVTLQAEIQADLQMCRPACDYSAANPGLFQMFATLEGGYDTHMLRNNATSADPSLDLSPLIHDHVAIEPAAGFVRTKTWAYEAFSGDIFLGHFTPGETFTVSYRLIARVGAEFPGFETWAAAAINDPFFLSSDPLPAFDGGAFTFVQAVPLPSPLPLLSAGALLVLGGRAVRRTAASVLRRARLGSDLAITHIHA